ncbi:MAG: ABC transporter permease [Vicinamibacterales bacterium]
MAGRAGRPRNYALTPAGARDLQESYAAISAMAGGVLQRLGALAGEELSPRRSGLGRVLAALLIRGIDAPFVLRDLDDAFEHDVARGLSTRAARRRDLRNVLASACSMWWEALRPAAWRPSLADVRLGFRSIRRTPGLSVVAVCALAIGIPVGLAPMHAVEALERPLPGDPDGRIRTVCYWRDTLHEPATRGDYAAWRTSLRSFETLAAYRATTVNLTEPAGPPIAAIESTATAFDVLHTPAMLGRVLRAEDERAGAPGVVVLGHDLWRARFGADRQVVGRTVTIGDEPREIVGVMPPGFRFPSSHELWMPLREEEDRGPRTGPALVVFGRLSPGATPEAAEAEVQALTSTLATDNPVAFERLRAVVLPSWHLTFGFPTEGGLRALPEFPLVQLLMLAPLLVACVNVGLLILAQTSTRGSEFAVRTALGAGRGRILTQVFVEFLVLAVLAAGAGLLLLDWLPARVLASLGTTLPYWIETGLTTHTVLRGLGLAVGCAVMAGVLPALRMTGRSLDANIRSARANRSGTRLGGLPGALIVIDVAVAVVAVGVAAGLWGKVQATLPRESVDGIRAAEFLSATLAVPSATPGDMARVQHALVERIGREPGVRAVTSATALPRMDHPTRLFAVDPGDASPASTASGPFKARSARVAVGFFEALARPLVAGRAFDARDLPDGAGTVIVNTTFARRAFGSASPIGRRVRPVASDGAAAGPWLEIVGMVGPLGMHALTPSDDEGVYLPLAEGASNPVRLAIRVSGDPAAVAGRLQELARAVDAAAVVSTPVPLDEMFEGDWYLLRAFVLAAILLVGVLLTLAASALYAILSLVVSRRTREIGIRVALGASRWDVAREVATRAVVQIGIGVALGLPFAGLLSYEFLEVTGAGGSVPIAVAMASALGLAVMLLVSVAACAAPTVRALRIAPMDALRAER